MCEFGHRRTPGSCRDSPQNSPASGSVLAPDSEAHRHVAGVGQAINIHLQNSEGLPAKHLPESGKFARQINAAGMAELVDARDLKSLGAQALCRFDPGCPHHAMSPHAEQTPSLKYRVCTPVKVRSWPVSAKMIVVVPPPDTICAVGRRGHR